MEEIKNKILEEYKKGNIIVATSEGLQSAVLSEFIKQPIELRMFIPCKLVDGKFIPYESYFTHNGNKNTICEPYEGLFEIESTFKCKGWKYLDPDKTRRYDSISYKSAEKEYQEAKERVLFEGYPLDKIKKFEDCVIINDSICFTSLGKCFAIHKSENYETIEDLVKYNLTLKIETAKKLNL